MKLTDEQINKVMRQIYQHPEQVSVSKWTSEPGLMYPEKT